MDHKLSCIKYVNCIKT